MVSCPICRQDTRVLKTEDTERRRECTSCGHRFTTVEKLKDDELRQARALAAAQALADQLKQAA